MAGNNERWKRFVDAANDFIQWLLGTVFMFVPANYLVQREDDGGGRTKPTIGLINNLFEVESKFHDFFLMTILIYMGFYLGSMWFHKPLVVQMFEAAGLIIGFIATLETLLYVGFEATVWVVCGCAFSFIILVAAKCWEAYRH